jgi:Mn-dependent DtxR family transcriptional regulator
MAISTLYREKDICCDVCWDGFSYGEKFTYSLLKQLGIKVKRHKYFEWSRNIYSEIESLCGSKEYDFYIKTDNMDILIETNGLQHYKDFSFSRRSYFEESENDKLKEKIALQNGIKEENYIVIDCRYSNLEFIKNSMLKNNKLTNRFDLNNIDWGKCEEDALCSYLVKACDYYNQGIGHMEIAKIMDIDFKTVKRYLKRARDYNLCDFKTRNELKIENKIKSIEMWNSRIHNSSEIARVLNLDNTVISDYLIEAEKEGIIEYKKYINSPKRKPIRNIEYNKEFDSINQASNMSKDVFGIQLYREGITNACNTGQAYKGLHFQYNDNTYSIQ